MKNPMQHGMVQQTMTEGIWMIITLTGIGDMEGVTIIWQMILSGVDSLSECPSI